MEPSSPPRFSKSTLFARISPDDVVLYANGALADYLGLPKEAVVGSPLDVIRTRIGGELSECFSRESGTRQKNRLLADAWGRVFEAMTYSEGPFLDVVLNEVSNAARVADSFNEGMATKAGELTEDELRAIWHPERRLLSVSFARLCGMDDLAARLPPVEARLMLNTFIEEACDAVIASGGAIGGIETDKVQGIHGAPRYFESHAWRAVRSVFQLEERLRSLRSGLIGHGKAIPPVASGVATGENLLATLNTPIGNRFSVTGPATALSAQLCRLARPGEILVCEFTLRKLLETAPEGWESMRTQNESPPDLSDMQWNGDEIQSLPASLERTVYLIGPGVREHPETAEFFMDYLYAVRAAGYDRPVPVLRIVSPDGGAAGLDLSQNNLVTSRIVQVLGKYKLIEVIGQGGMGKVWRAQDRFGNVVAIKVLNSAETASEETIRRFRREAQIMARLPHRNICRVYEIDEYEGMQFLVMEFVEGLTLADLLYEGMDSGDSSSAETDLPSLIRSLKTTRDIGSESGNEFQHPIAETSSRPKTNRVLPVEQTLNLFGKICDAVQFAHEHGVLHRDLKPGNVLLREDGEPLVADFGLAKAASEEGSLSLSVSGLMIGTLENMSPEQAESSKDVDERADVYSLGTILYQMLTGRRHFETTGNIIADAQTLKNHTPLRPRSINPSLDPDLELICLKALRSEPAERYRNVAALKGDIERYRRGEIISARPVTALELLRKLLLKHRGISTIIAGALLLLTVVATVSFWQINERRIEAEDALRSAGEAALRADEALAAAERSRQLSEARQRQTESALREKSDALAALEKAVQEAQSARNAQAAAAEKMQIAQRESEEQRSAREKVEATAKALEEELESLKFSTTQAAVDLPSEPEPSPSRAPRRDFKAEAVHAKESLRRAILIVTFEFTPFELRARSRPFKEVIARASEAIGLISSSLTLQPANPFALALKGRLHLALGELDLASQAFEKGVASLHSMGDMVLPESESPLPLDRLAEMTSRAGRENWTASQLASELESLGTREDQIAAALLRFLASSAPGRSSPLPKVDREFLPGEILFNLLAANPGHPAFVQLDPLPDGSLKFTASEAADLRSLAPLRRLKITEIEIYGCQEIDWQTLLEINPLSLSIIDSKSSSLPPSGPRTLNRLLNADFSGTPLPSLSFLRGATLLETLNLSGTPGNSLPPISGRYLRSLDISSIEPPSLAPLNISPLSELTLSPKIAANPEILQPLRANRSLRVLRTPSDPPKQSVQEFWQKLANGSYAPPKESPEENPGPETQE